MGKEVVNQSPQSTESQQDKYKEENTQTHSNPTDKN